MTQTAETQIETTNKETNRVAKIKIPKTTLKDLALLVSEFPLKESLAPFQEINTFIVSSEDDIIEVPQAFVERLLSYLGDKSFSIVSRVLNKAMAEIEQTNRGS